MIDRPPGSEPQSISLDELPGRYLLLGLTIKDDEGDVTARHQLHGIVRSADLDEGIVVDLKGMRDGHTYVLPPDTRSFQRAMAGSYRLRETDEEIQDPDFLAAWVAEPEHDEDPGTNSNDVR